MANTPAGWYPQQDGRQRYWDGETWSEHFAPGTQQDPATAGGAPLAPGATAAAHAPARPWFKKKRFMIPAGLAGLAILGSAVGGGDADSPGSSTAIETPLPAAATKAPAAPSPSAPAKAAAPAAAPAAKPNNTPKYGSKVRDGKFEFVVTGMKCGLKTVGSEYLSTKAQGEFCRASMNITNIGDEAQSMFADNQFTFDAKGRKFSADTEASVYDDKSEVLFEEINPGNTVEGRVYFDVPKGAKLVRMELHDSMFSDGVQIALKK